MCDRGPWFPRIIMRALCGLPSVKKQNNVQVCKWMFTVATLFFFRSMYNKTIIRFGLLISRIIKVSLRVISRSRRFHASCGLPSVKKQIRQRPGLKVNVYCRDISFFVQCIIKQLLDSVFVISRIIKVSVRVISLSLRLWLITLTSTLIILDITKMFKITRTG